MASAQTTGIPTLPPADEPVADPAAGAAAPATTASGPARQASWDYSLGLALGWESNAGLMQLSDAPSDYAAQLRGNLARSVRTVRSTFNFAANAVAFTYLEQKDYNRLDGSLALDASRRFSAATTGSLGLSAGYFHTDSSPILGEQGVLLPLASTVNYTGNLAVNHQLSPRTSLGLSLRGYRVVFPDSEFDAGGSVRFGAEAARRPNPRDTLALSYGLERASVLGGVEPGTSSGAFWTHYGSGRWERVLSPRTAFGVDVGASYTQDAASSTLSQPWNFFGGVGLNRQINRSSLTAFYRREVLPAFGLGGLRLTDRLGLELTTPLGRNWSTALGGSYARTAGNEPLEDAIRYLDAHASIGRGLSRRLRLSLDGRYLYQSQAGETPAIDNYRVGLVLSFGPGGHGL